MPHCACTRLQNFAGTIIPTIVLFLSLYVQLPLLQAMHTVRMGVRLAVRRINQDGGEDNLKTKMVTRTLSGEILR